MPSIEARLAALEEQAAQLAQGLTPDVIAPRVFTRYGNHYPNELRGDVASRATGLTFQMFFVAVRVYDTQPNISIRYMTGATASGNALGAIYAGDWVFNTPVLSWTGQTAQAAAGNWNTLDFNTGGGRVDMSPGIYIVGINFASATATFMGARTMGLGDQITRPDITWPATLPTSGQLSNTITAPAVLLG